MAALLDAGANPMIQSFHGELALETARSRPAAFLGEASADDYGAIEELLTRSSLRLKWKQVAKGLAARRDDEPL